MTDPPLATHSPRSPWREAWRRLRQNRLAVSCGGILIAIFLACLIGPLVTGQTIETQNLDLGATSPSAQHWLGTDPLGRDLLTRILSGGRVSLAVGLTATLVSLLIGVAYGATSGFLGGRADAIMMRIVDILSAIPYRFVLILLLVMFGRSMFMIFVGIGLLSWLGMARIVRGQTLSLKHKEYIEAARASGVSSWKIILRHILPNLLGVVAVYTTLLIPDMIMAESFISFLGLGVQEPLTSLGALIAEGSKAIVQGSLWQLYFPLAFFTVTLYAFYFVGDGLRDALDPKDR